MSNISTIVVFFTFPAVLGCCTYIYLRNKSLDDIRADVYQLFLQAEHAITGTEKGQEKMAWVVRQARYLLPEWLQDFVTEPFLYMVIQAWFDAVKDLLDDGKYNNSVEEIDNEQQ